jgi:hypothetical protein
LQLLAGYDADNPGNEPAGAVRDSTTPASSATDTDVSIDQTKPTISGAPDRRARDDWYAADVTVSFSCADPLSGVASCSSPTTLGEGCEPVGDRPRPTTRQRTATVGDLNIDKTDPTISNADLEPNGAGWYRERQWTCADALSGIGGSCRAHHGRG